MLLTLTMRPRCGISSGATASHMFAVPLKFTLMVASASSAPNTSPVVDCVCSACYSMCFVVLCSHDWGGVRPIGAKHIVHLRGHVFVGVHRAKGPTRAPASSEAKNLTFVGKPCVVDEDGDALWCQGCEAAFERLCGIGGACRISGWQRSLVPRCGASAARQGGI